MKTSLALLIALCAIFDDLQAASLKDGWVSYKGGKYIAKLNELATWPEASKSCKEQGYELLSVESEAEHNEIIEIFGHLITNRLWLAGTDLGSEGQFYWITTGVNFDYSAWHVGEPSGNNPFDEVKEDCVQYWNRNGTILWNDGPCDYKANFTCEFNDPCARYPF